MIEIKAGAELDEAVADAIDLQYFPRTGLLDDSSHTVLITPREWDEIRGIEHITCEGDIACIPFQPSIDLNAAFAAAEKVELFDHETPPSYRRCLFGVDDDTWCVGGPGLSADGPTPALAICAAILKLKEVTK